MASQSNIKAKAYPLRFESKIRFQVNDPSITDHGLTLNPKDFVIEPRTNTPLADRIYSTQSPFDSETHFQLLEEFEALMRKKTLHAANNLFMENTADKEANRR